jgi:recombinational DNA repair ATPase RecF
MHAAVPFNRPGCPGVTPTVAPRHPDAIGYLIDLAEEVNEPWFRMICDLAVTSGTCGLDQPTLNTLFGLYEKKAIYVGTKLPAAISPSTAATATADSLEELSGFTGLKLLGETLEVSFRKRITLVFGANGSGKSSLCECLKALAAPDPPRRPLQNVRARGAGPPSFRYKFKSDKAHETWTPAVGYGHKQTTVKYFDGAIAVGNIRDAVDLGRVVVLTPYRLNVFDLAKDLTTSFREQLYGMQTDNSTKLTELLATIRTDFAAFAGRPLAGVDDANCAVLEEAVQLGKQFADGELLSERLATIAEMEKAASDDGLKLLRAEHRELEKFLADLTLLITSTSEWWALEPAAMGIVLADKQAAQAALAHALIPIGGTLEGFMPVLRAAAAVCELDDGEGHDCPLCRRPLGAPEIELFRLYHGLLQGELEKEIAALKATISRAGSRAALVLNFDPGAWDRSTAIPAELITAAKAGAGVLIADCDVSREPTVEAKAALESLRGLEGVWAARLEAKKNALDIASSGRQNLVQQLAEVREQTAPLEYARTIADHLMDLMKAHALAEEAQSWRTRLPAMTPILKKITDRAKEANEELVVKDFDSRLNREYLALAEKNMASFGVTLVRRGAEAAVTVLPQVGGRDIESVLSEGEQRLHALALFFAELESCPQSVLVFDDPVSSFDYNYITNYCVRLRDVAQKYPERQIIVLTHNWEFFVQLQVTLNQAQLGGHLSVQTLENCVAIADYSEKIDELSRDIQAVLAQNGEPTQAEKEVMAGKMRRLIEAVVNTHVFNGQRHQFKQPRQEVSAYQKFTKVVPLLPDEANLLGDLFRKLSVPEHDDPRNAYVNTDKAAFQTRYKQIKDVEGAIIGRKQP